MRGLNENVHELEGRGIGYAHGIYWFYIRNSLTLWTYNEEDQVSIKMKKKLELDSLIYSVNIGHIRGVEKKFNKSEFLILAIGVASSI